MAINGHMIPIDKNVMAIEWQLKAIEIHCGPLRCCSSDSVEVLFLPGPFEGHFLRASIPPSPGKSRYSKVMGKAWSGSYRIL